MTFRKRLYLLPILLLSLAFDKTAAQKFDDKMYERKMDLIKQLSMYNMAHYDTLFHIATLDTAHGNEYRNSYYGWIDERDADGLQFINTNGRKYKIDQSRLTEIKALPVDQKTIQIFAGKLQQDGGLSMGDFGKNYLLQLWLYNKGHADYSRQFLPRQDTFFSDGCIINDFGIIYYDGMLSAYSYERNYEKAIVFSKHLSKDIFHTYNYQNEAIALTAQLQKNTEDFKAFHLPDSLEWERIKQQWSRKEQILFLAARLRLLNCIQPGQPADINYADHQYAISYVESHKLNVSYWEPSAKYSVINPYTLLLQMKLTPQEMELLLPYLLDETYIPSYYYFRDFMPSRTLHKVNRVAHDLIFEIANKNFYSQQTFDLLSFDEKKAEVEKIRQWCHENAALSQEALTLKTLKTCSKWVDFNKALETAREAKYDSILPVIAARFNDFNGEKIWTWPSIRGVMAQTMFELGDKTYLNTVKKWSKDTTDNWVNLWTSLFILKNDSVSYKQAMVMLEGVLKKCDGTTFYPYAMDFLLSRNDKRALKLAEGIVDKEQFQRSLMWGSYLNFIKKLLRLKSDYTFNFMSKNLDHFTSDEMERLKSSAGQDMLMPSDFYVLAVDKLKSDDPGYSMLKGTEAKLAYKQALKQWFDKQYQLLKEGKPHELHLTEVKEALPVSVLDTRRY